MAITINTRSVSNTSWGSVDKTALRNRLLSALEEGEEGAAAAIREVYAVIKETPLTESPSDNWWGPHHVLTGDAVVLNRDGLFAAAGALAGARTEPDLSSEQKQKAARHLIRHYRQIEAEIPEGLTEIAAGRQDSNEKAIRYDIGRFGKTKIDSQSGFLHTQGRLTRTGIFTYRLPDGSARKELRLDEEVFNSDSIASFNHIPITNNHPFPRRLVTSKNAVEHQKGYTLGDARQDGEHLVASLIVTDEGTINDIKKGKQALSNGYTCDLDFSPGSFEGKTYDAIQRNIVGNHVAIIAEGTARAGSSARLTLDSVDDPADDNFLANIAVMDSDENIDSDFDDKDEPINNQKNKDRKMEGVEIKIDDVVYKDVRESVAQAVLTGLQKRQDKIDLLNTEAKTRTDELSEVQGKLTATETALEKAKEEKTDEKDIEERVITLANERASLISSASKFLKEDEMEKLDKASPLEIMKAVILSEDSDAKFDEVDNSFIKGQYAMTVKYATDRNDKAGDQTKKANDAKNTDTSEDDVPDSEKARTDSMAKIYNTSRGIEETKKEGK